MGTFTCKSSEGDAGESCLLCLSCFLCRSCFVYRGLGPNIMLSEQRHHLMTPPPDPWSERALALCMGCHARLGEASQILALEEHLMPLILALARCARPAPGETDGLWHTTRQSRLMASAHLPRTCLVLCAYCSRVMRGSRRQGSCKTRRRAGGAEGFERR